MLQVLYNDDYFSSLSMLFVSDDDKILIVNKELYIYETISNDVSPSDEDLINAWTRATRAYYGDDPISDKQKEACVNRFKKWLEKEGNYDKA